MPTQWTAVLLPEIGRYSPTKDIRVQFKHKYEDKVSFAVTLQCVAKHLRMAGLMTSRDETSRIFSRRAAVHMSQNAQECILSFHIPERFDARPPKSNDPWNLSVDRASVSCEWTESDEYRFEPRVQAPPPSFVSGNLVQLKYEINYFLEAGNVVVGTDIDHESQSQTHTTTVELPFVFTAAEPCEYTSLQLRDWQNTLSLPPDQHSSLHDPLSLNSSILLREVNISLSNNQVSPPCKLEFQLPGRLIQEAPMQIPYRIKPTRSTNLSASQTIICQFAVSFNQYLKFDLSSTPKTLQQKGRQIRKKVIRFVVEAELNNDKVIRGRTPVLEISQEDLIPTFQVRNKTHVPPARRFPGEIACYCQVHVGYTITEHVHKLEEPSEPPVKGEFQWDVAILESSHASTIDIGIYKPSEPAYVSDVSQSGRYPQQESIMQGSDGVNLDNPPDYDTLSVRTMQTLPRYEDQ